MTLSQCGGQFSIFIFPLGTLLVATAAMRSVLAEIKASGAPIEMLPFDAFLDFLGVGEIRELEQRLATSDTSTQQEEQR